VLSYLGLAVAAPPAAVNNPFGPGRPGLAPDRAPGGVTVTGGGAVTGGGKPVARPFGVRPGVFGTKVDVIQPVPVPSIEDSIVYRAQFKVRTADRGDANQDDGVKIRLNGMNETWLDTARDDFERGATHTYDLMLVGTSGITVGKLRDIQMLEISKPGSDGWCFSDIELIVNNVTVYKQSFPSGHWLDNSGSSRPSLTISGAQLRSSPLWRAYRFPAPSPVVTRDEIEARLEGALGHFLHGKRVTPGKMYGRNGVEVSHKDAQTLHVDLDLELEINNFPNQEVDVDFDIHFAPNGSQVQVSLQNLKIDLPGKLASAILAVNGVLGGTSKAELTRHIERQVMRQLQGGRFNIPTTGYTVSVIVGGNGNLVIIPKKL
jgi:hypothetical protein